MPSDNIAMAAHMATKSLCPTQEATQPKICCMLTADATATLLGSVAVTAQLR
jgi:xanthine/uracil/vitamin C permease (AzgA family)